MKQMKYTRTDLKSDFPNDDACLEWLKDYLYPDGIFCPNDKKITPHHKLRQRKAYSCELCGHHTYPTAGTIFHKSSTPLTKWFDAIYIMSATRAGISAKQLERELGVTYKTAWRMFHQIRSMMGDDSDKLVGEVEIDEMYLGPNPLRRTTAVGRKGQVVFGAVQRGGRAKLTHLPEVKGHLLPQVYKDVDPKAQVYSDGLLTYRTLYNTGWSHKSVNHQEGQWVSKENRQVHTQNIENIWSNMKRGFRGVYRHCDAKYLQAYADEYAFRYSHRNDFQPMFWALIGKVSTENHSESS